MTDDEYHQRLNNCKTPEERKALNDEFLAYRRKVRKSDNRKKYFKDNHLALITIVIASLDLILTIIALVK